ncbi:MAG TPA: hypothetical protein VGO89_09750, partial [Streptomyces sp.]|nr:hypothetical protein [Streptomyces sp.]
MAALKCSRCGARIQMDGTSSCSCALTAIEEVEAIFDGFRPRPKPESSEPVEDSTPEAVPEQTEETVPSRMGRRGKVAVLGVVAAVTLGTAAFTVKAISSGQETQDGDRPSVSATSDSDVAAPEWMERSDVPSSGEPHDGGSSESANSDASHDEGGDEAEGSGTHDGSGSPTPHDDYPSPSPSGDAAGGTSQGGGSSDGGSTGGGSTDGGSTDGGSTDGGSTDGGSADGGSTDGGSTDGGSTDGGSTDGGGDGDESGG